jgi:serine/threonine protein kinase
VAVKYVPKVRLRETQKERIRSEIRLLDSVIKLNSGPHPHILRLIEAYETSTAFFIVTELLDIDLFEAAAERPFTEEETRHIVVSLCRALEFLHRNRIVHRDLKLENVYLSSKDDLLSSIVKLGDFGLARQLRSKSVKEEGENELYSPCGTPTYLAPEVAKSEGYSMSADLWSLGVLTYILLYGYPPFASDDVDELLQQIVVADYSLPSEGCSEEASNLVRGLLERDPQKRLSSQQVLSHPWITGGRLEREDGFHNDSRPRLSLNLRKRTSSFSSRKPSTRSAAPRATSFSSPLLTSTLLRSQSSSRSETEMPTLKEAGSGSERSDIRRLGEAGVASPSINNCTR